MLHADLQGKKLMYLGSIDDKVVQYQKIRDPERQLLHTLFFSAILGDPLVLNDGYLLHSDWGRKQLMNPRSAVRQLNQQKHLVLVKRSSKPYSEWINDQAEKTQSYRDLRDRCKGDDFARLDAAWSDCTAAPWPELDLQATMRTLLQSSAHELLELEIPRSKLEEHGKRFEGWLAKETVRSAWESALLEMQVFDDRERGVMMEFVNEAYHASFACGFAGAAQAEVGIAGYGRRRLHTRGAYQQEDGESLSELLLSEQFQKSEDSLRSLATVYVTNRESELFDGSAMATFLEQDADAKAAYRASLQQLLRGGQPTQERIEAVEHALDQYGKVLQGSFGVRENKAALKLIEWMGVAGEQINSHKECFMIASKIVGAVSAVMPAPAVDMTTAVADHWEAASNLVSGAVPVVTNVYVSLQRRRSQPVSLLPEQGKSSYELSLDPAFVRDATDGIPAFTRAD